MTLQARHRDFLLTGVARPPTKFAASRRYAERGAFADAWRSYIAKVTVEARFAVEEELARRQRERKEGA